MTEHQHHVDTSWPLHVPRRGWLKKDVAKGQLSFDLGAEQLAAVRTLVAEHVAAGHPYTEITREQFSHPDLDAFLERSAAELKRGAGVVFVRGIPVDEFSLEEIRLLYWGIGTHFGFALSQSVIGDLMGDVMHRPGSKRGYTGDQELGLHTDYTEIGALLCIQAAKEGGDNTFVSSLALWDIIEREHPEYMPVLKRGFRTWRMDEHREEQEPVTPYYVPVFAEQNGLRSVYWSWLTADATARFLGQPLSALEAAAVRFIYEVLSREELKFTSRLDRGEIVFFNNFEVLHSRSSFTQWDEPDKARHLLRLWLQCEPQRPIPDEMKIWRNPSGLLGRDPDPRFAGDQFTKLGDNPAALFMKDYFSDFYTGKRPSEEVVLERLGAA